MADFPDHAQLANISLIESLYESYLKDPKSVDTSWCNFFEGIEFASYLHKRGVKEGGASTDALRIFSLIQAYRRFGHRLAHFNPVETKELQEKELELKSLNFTEDELDRSFPSLGLCEQPQAPLKEIIQALQQIYCTRIGFEYMDLDNCELEAWIQKRIEPKLTINLASQEKQLILESLNKSEVFETFLNVKYQGQTRFSLEGVETLIPVLREIASFGAELGMEEFVIGTAHRGRLNVLANILNKSYAVIFKEFEDTIPFSYGESSDVKYHKGFSSDVPCLNGKSIHLSLSANSSCLESTDAVVLGQARAKQQQRAPQDRWKVGAILMHGDAALAGQGVVYESLQMMHLPGFRVGGTIHIAINNQIGYTTLPSEGRSMLYCTDIAKAFGVPVFHVNAEDPEGCIFAARLALEIRLKFQTDVFIDLNGFRKYGHNEGDEPSFTQPLQYQLIRMRPPIRQLYSEQLQKEGIVEKKMAEEFEAQFKETLSSAFEKGKVEEPVEPVERFGKIATEFIQPPDEELFKEVETAAGADLLQQIAKGYCHVPENFQIHPKLAKWLEGRVAMVQADPKENSIDWGMAECLALGSIAVEEIPVRLAGQDALRGTFSQRHGGWFDQKTGELYLPFLHLKEGQAPIHIYNTILSEYAALAFEFGYSWSMHKGLTLWEAQYGDFIIGAEILIDHYLVCAEQKWGRYSSLTLLLPHGYEGGGPEHSSARLERFLQLSANNNIQVIYPTTPAQYFHVLRRQALRTIRKPLILFTPKSLLRLPFCKSALNQFTSGTFQEILDDPAPPREVKRLFFCSGKIYYDLLTAREKFPDAAIIRLEQIFPLHKEKFQKILAKYSAISECLWVQEEPENMGAWEHLRPQFQQLMPHLSLRYVGRARSSSPATGSRRKHKEEQAAILNALQGK